MLSGNNVLLSIGEVMKIATVIEKFKNSGDFFRCPICQHSFSLTGDGSFVCSNNHCFDLSSKGYVHLLPGTAARDARYANELFQSRKAVFHDGFFEPVARSVCESVQKFMPQQSRTILDAGCGEGYYAIFLSQLSDIRVFALDNSKDAILSAVRESGDACFAVADLAGIPVHDGRAGVLLNILAPANYTEFARVLCAGGVMIKVFPGRYYLRELRACVAGDLRYKEYSNQKTIGHMAENADIADHKTIQYTLPVSQKQLASFYKMTPLTSHVPPIETVDLSGISEITIHLEVIVAYPRKR